MKTLIEALAFILILSTLTVVIGLASGLLLLEKPPKSSLECPQELKAVSYCYRNLPLSFRIEL